MKNVQVEQLPYELFVRRRQKTKIWNPFANNMLADVKPSKVKLSKII